MRNLILSIAAVLVCMTAKADADTDRMWEEANTAYMNGNYHKAIITYDSIVSMGYSGSKLFYNLGNAYFKEGWIGKSILNYNRALRLSPADADIRHNLAIANTYVKDRIDKMPEVFFRTWMRDLRRSFSSNGWAYLSIVFFALMLGAGLLFLLSGKIALRKTGFYCGIAALVLFAASLSFSLRERKSILYPDEAVIMSGAVSVKSSPDTSSKDIFILHEGTKVKILGQIDQWREIRIEDGNKGWIPEDAIEIIN